MRKLFLLLAVAMIATSAGGCRNGCGWRHSWFNNDDCCTYSPCDPCGCSSCGTTYGGGEVIYGGATMPGPVTVQPTSP